MKNIGLIVCVFFYACITGREEIQVKSSYATVMGITIIGRYGSEDRAVFHLKSENNIRFYLEAPMSDTSRYVIGERYPFLSPR